MPVGNELAQQGGEEEVSFQGRQMLELCQLANSNFIIFDGKE